MRKKRTLKKYMLLKGKLEGIGREKDIISAFIIHAQKFDNRALVVLLNEMNHWKQIFVNFMTEESDDSDDQMY